MKNIIQLIKLLFLLIYFKFQVKKLDWTKNLNKMYISITIYNGDHF